MDLELLRRTEYNQQYIAAMRPVFNRRALFTDTSAESVSYTHLTLPTKA